MVIVSWNMPLIKCKRVMADLFSDEKNKIFPMNSVALPGAKFPRKIPVQTDWTDLYNVKSKD